MIPPPESEERAAQNTARLRAALGSLLFLIVAPGTMAGLIPWLLTGWEAQDMPWPARLAGAAMIVVGFALLLPAFARFALEGNGTPAPISPTEHLVVGGAYRHVRNPMYVAVTSLILGQALIFGSLELVLWGAVFLVVTAVFVITYEEPTLTRRYGAEYRAYRSAVPGWIPRLHPWSG